MNMRSALTIAHIGGIEIRIHYSWLFIFVLVTWSLAQGYFPLTHPGWDATAYWVAGISASLLFFLSVLIHELGHSFVARTRGVEVPSITLFIFGGVAQLSDDAPKAMDEFLIAIMGPMTSFLLAASYWSTRAAFGLQDTAPGAVLAYLTYINILLGVFNLLPGFPLDGGRVLRSILWGATGNQRRATDIASYVGQAMGFLLIFIGISRLLGGAVLNGMWMAFIGWFLSNAAAAARQAQVVKDRLSGIRVAQMMDAEPPVATADMTVQEFVFWHVLRHGIRGMPVVEHSPNGLRVIGLVSVTDVKELPRSEWPTTSIVQIMTPAPLKTVTPDTTIHDALKVLVQESLNQLPVMRGDVLVGLLTRAQVLQALQLSEELQVESMRNVRTGPVGPAVSSTTGQPSTGILRSTPVDPIDIRSARRDPDDPHDPRERAI